MTNIMEVPSVSLIVEYDPVFHSWKLTAVFQIGTNNKLTAIHQISAEALAKAYTIEPILYTALDEMTKHMVKVAPWIAHEWLYHCLGKQMEALIQHQTKPFSASGGTHDSGGAMDLTVKAAKDYVDPAYPATKSLSEMSDNLPGMNVEVDVPCECFPKSPKAKLKTLIMHINDEHAPDGDKKIWTSDDLCDWLDMLHDSGVVNLEVEIPDKEIENADSN